MGKVKEKLRLVTGKAVNGVKNFMADESGMGTIEVILIIVVLIGLVMVFKTEIRGLVQEVISHIKSDAQTIYN